jgi:hypothetical protein
MLGGTIASFASVPSSSHIVQNSYSWLQKCKDEHDQTPLLIDLFLASSKDMDGLNTFGIILY